ncbi:hypothetical protein ABVK25_007487 [Lepraria finkii]|uniref:Uncharacterized protein n=1 Tax=Lepraria finkii TaxID=1340010 RepID=A0ABR4B909_9LECA
MSKVRRRWSREEDALLREETDLQLAANNGDIKDWNEIAKKIPGRSNKDCRKRFMNEVQGGLKKVKPYQ